MNAYSVLQLAWNSVAYYEHTESIGFYIFAVFSAVVSSCPKAITLKTLDPIYVAGMLSLIIPCAANALGVEWFDGWFYKTGGLTNGSMLVCMSLLNLRVWLNLLFMMAFAVSLSLQPGGPALSNSLRSVAFLGIILVWLDCFCKRGVRLELHVRDSSSQLSAIRSLLNRICDATVEMDSGLRIAEHSSQLAGLLFQNPLNSLMGRTLQEFMPEHADRQRFDQYMQGADEAAEHAAVFHTKLLDSVGSAVDIELFSVSFKDAGERRRHLLGIRELTDIQPMAALPQPAGLPPPAGLPRPAATRRPPQREHSVRNGLGTPALVELCDLQSGASSSSSASSTSQAAAKPMQIPTHDVAKMMTMMMLLQGWHVPRLSSDCCAYHTGVNAGIETLLTFARSPCTPECGSETSWQCMRCGIKDKRFRRNKSSGHCNLCADVPNASFNQPERVQTNVQMSL